MELPISNLMSRSIVSATPRTPLLDVIRTMRDERLSCMVITEKGMPVGIVTERDIVRTLAETLEGDAIDHNASVGSYMSTPPVTLQENATLFEALVIARSHQIRHLPVVSSGGEYIGILTQSNLVQAHFDMIDRQTEVLEKNVLERTAELTEVNARLLALSLTDSLLEIGNRRAMEVDLEHTVSGALRHQQPCSIALLDVDYFKRYNDHYGHQAGDQALRDITLIIKAGIRNQDRLYRYGGEELLLLLPNTSVPEATQLLQRLLHSLAQQRLPHQDSPLGFLSLSAGIAGMRTGDDHIQHYRDLISEADRALYDAKENGRNRIAVATPESH